MALHFERSEFDARQRRACAQMAAEGLDGLLLFRQESMFYLTGYDTGGFSMFQGMYMTAEGRIALVTRTADRLQSRMTSVIEDIRIWIDREGANPAVDLREMMRDLGAAGKHVGVEYHAYGLTAQRGKLVDAALDGFCTVSDASDTIRKGADGQEPGRTPICAQSRRTVRPGLERRQYHDRARRVSRRCLW